MTQVTDARIYVGSIGVGITVDVDDDLDGAYDGTLLVKKPDGTEVEWPASVTTADTPTNGEVLCLVYHVVEGDLDQSGRYKVQPRWGLSGGIFYGNTDTFRVYPRYR